MSSFLRRTLSPVLVGCIGVALAWVWVNLGYLIPAITITSVIGLASITAWLGHKRLRIDPVLAVRLLEAWAVVPVVVLAAATSGLIVVAIEVSPPTSWSPDNRSFLVASIAALTGAAASGLADAVKEGGLAVGVSGHVERAFKRAFPAGFFEADSDAERAIYSTTWRGLTSWERSDRLRRAAVIAAALKPKE